MNRQHTTTDTETIEVPEEIVVKLRNRFDSKEYSSVDAFAAEILDRMLWELKRLDADDQENPAEDRTRKQQSIDASVAEQLDSLGYR